MSAHSDKRALALAFTAVASVAFGLSLALPMFSLHAGEGALHSVLLIFSPGNAAAQTYTLPGALRELWRHGDYVLAVILGCCSLLLPVVKFCVLWWERAEEPHVSPRALSVVRATSRYAMAEVFAVALLALAAQRVPGGGRLELHLGFAFFTSSVLLSLAASNLQSRRVPPQR